MKKETPVWFGFFMISLLLLFVSAIVFLTFYIMNIKEREQKLTDDNVLMNMHYTETNIDNFLENYEEMIGNINLAEYFYYARENDYEEYKSAIYQRMKTMYSDSSKFIALFYQDVNQNCFSVGEVFMSIDSQVDLINECKTVEQYTANNELWFYKSIGRGYNSIVLCKDLIYIDNNYSPHKLGTIVVYFDADKFSNTFFYNDKYNKVVVVDLFGKIVLSSDSKIIGESYENIYSDETEVHNTYLKEKNMSFNSWKIISYAEMDEFNRMQRLKMLRVILLMFLVLAFVSIIFYVLSKRIGKPIDALNDDLKKEIRLNLEMQLMLKEATIKTYEQQMNPHFLFNTLNMMCMMNALGRKEDVATVITCLGDLLRFNLDKRNQVTFREEIENVKNYLKIIELRFKRGFHYSIIFPDEIMDCYTIKFLIQPLIENAVRHGFKNKKENCEIVIMGEMICDELVIIIKDNGYGVKREELAEIKKKLSNVSLHTEGIGLVNVNERIRIIYGEQYGIDIFSEYEKNTQLLVHMPVCKIPNERVDKDV